MGQMDILNVFFEDPARDFQIRGISKQLKIPKTTVSYHIGNLLKDKLIIKEKKSVFPSFKANETSEFFRLYKRQEFVKKILGSGLLDYIEEVSSPRCIVLFGSFAKGEYDKGSDIDLFIQAKETNMEMSKFEKKLKHKIHILFEHDLKRISTELLNNIINGIKLRGFLKIK